jgi:hypothetical protein
MTGARGIENDRERAAIDTTHRHGPRASIGRQAGWPSRLAMAVCALLLGSLGFALVGLPAAGAATPTSIPVGSGPNAVGANPLTNTIYVANQGAGNVS